MLTQFLEKVFGQFSLTRFPWQLYNFLTYPCISCLPDKWSRIRCKSGVAEVVSRSKRSDDVIMVRSSIINIRLSAASLGDGALINDVQRVTSLALTNDVLPSLIVRLDVNNNNNDVNYLACAIKRDKLIALERAVADDNRNKLEIWGKAQRESARRPKSDWGKLKGGVG